MSQTLSYYAADDEVRAHMAERPADVRGAYEALIEMPQFQEAVESDTAGIPHTADRLSLWGAALQDALGVAINIPRLEPNEFGEFRFVV